MRVYVSTETQSSKVLGARTTKSNKYNATDYLQHQYSDIWGGFLLACHTTIKVRSEKNHVAYQKSVLHSSGAPQRGSDLRRSTDGRLRRRRNAR